jgi:hypothetical protein
LYSDFPIPKTPHEKRHFRKTVAAPISPKTERERKHANYGLIDLATSSGGREPFFA